MKKVLLCCLLGFVSTVHATEEVSKFNLCLEAGVLAGYAYEAKEQNIKLDYKRSNDLILNIFAKHAIEAGTKARTRQAAIERGHRECLNSKLWAEK